MPSNTSEVWKPIADFPGYEVSDQGQVRSFYRRIGGATGWDIANDPQRILKGAIKKNGYHFVLLHRNGVSSNCMVHRLVAHAFLGECPEGMEVCHNDSDSQNNSPENLRYDTHYANMQDAVDQGTMKGNTGNQILTEAQVIDIRTRYSDGQPMSRIAVCFERSIPAISEIVCGLTYRQMGGPRKIVKPRVKLNWDLVRQLRRDRNKKGMSLLRVAAKYEISVSAVSLIARGKRWIEPPSPR